MEDDKIRDLFKGFEPDLSSDVSFMNRLRCKLDSVELVRQHHAAVKARSRKAVVIAAMAGFVAGCLCSLALPYVGTAVASWRMSMPDESLLTLLADYYQVLAWLVIGGMAMMTAMNAYDLSLAVMKMRRK